MRWPLVALLISGCGFSVETDPVLGDDSPGDEPAPDAPTVAPRMCATTDPSLRLCLDFDGTTGLANDASAFAHPVEAQNLVPMSRDGEVAVSVDATSHIWIPESDELDVRTDLTVSMWIKAEGPIVGTTRWLYDNNTQYFASVRPGGFIRCGSGTVVADSIAIVDSAWHHVACTYEEDETRVYIDGHVAGCEETGERDLPTMGNDGLAIGANLSMGPGGPKFAEQFVGGIDNVQVFAKLLPPQDLCTAAGGSVCNTLCP